MQAGYFQEVGTSYLLEARPGFAVSFFETFGRTSTATEIDVLECSQIQADCILVLLMNIPGLLVPNT